MSINYHASQSRGVPFAEHEAAAEQWRGAFTGFGPERIARLLGLKWDDEYLQVVYFQTEYRLRLADGYLEKKTGEEWSEQLYFNEAMAIYHLLKYTKDNPRITGTWTPADTMDGVVSRNTRMPDPLLAPFAKQWSGNCQELDLACQRAGGKKLDRGDVAYQFAAFPCFGIQMIFWDADEDFDAQVQILVDRCATDFVHYETIGCITADLLDRINQSRKSEEEPA